MSRVKTKLLVQSKIGTSRNHTPVKAILRSKEDVKKKGKLLIVQELSKLQNRHGMAWECKGFVWTCMDKL